MEPDGVDLLPTAIAEKMGRLRRVLSPESIALVGLSGNSRFLETVRPTLESSARVHIVNRRSQTVLGHETMGTLGELDEVPDVVMSFLNAERSVVLAEEAARIGTGGLVLIAGGFAESNSTGASLQRRLHGVAIGSGMQIVGPNSMGFINVPRSVSLTIASPHEKRAGGISIVSQSGSLLSSVALAAWEYRGCGLNLLISSGNEATTDLTDYLDYLIQDPKTTAIGLIIEKVRRPAEFLRAVRRAVRAGKPIVALKLARNERTQEMALSHTGAMTGDAWSYDVALRQAGVELAYDPEELVDRLALFDQVTVTPAMASGRLGVVSMTGGVASLAGDIAAVEDVRLPELPSFKPWLERTLPGVSVANPLDTTGLGLSKWAEILAVYATSDELDSILVVHPLAEQDVTRAAPLIADLRDVAQRSEKLIVLSNLSGSPAPWAIDLVGPNAVYGRGVRPTLRGLSSLNRFARFMVEYDAEVEREVVSVPAPQPWAISDDSQNMVNFSKAVELVRNHGLPTVDNHVVGGSDTGWVPPFEGPWVVKLADVAHRTDIGAVRLGVTEDGLTATVTELRDLSVVEGVPSTIVVQPMENIVGEVFVGVNCVSDFGPIVILGLGGIFAEMSSRIVGLVAPFNRGRAVALVEEFADLGVFQGYRGLPAWDIEDLADILVKVGDFAAGASGWLASLDLNPIIWTGTSFQVVDVLMISYPPDSTGVPSSHTKREAKE